MPQPWCVFLRGVNVNGVTVRMDALKEAFRAMGHPEARTVLATGNVVVLLGDADPARHRAGIERALSDTFSYDAHVFLRSAEEIGSICAAAKKVAVPADFHQYLLLLEDEGTLAALSEAFGSLPHAAGERFLPLGRDAFWLVPKGQTLGSPFGSKALGSRRFKNVLTSRNMNTVEKIRSAMESIPASA